MNMVGISTLNVRICQSLFLPLIQFDSMHGLKF